MKIWLSKSSEAPIPEQLTLQVILGIVSADLSAGERLPSTNQLARQFHLHPNTIRAAYRRLVERGWLEWRKGSGFYVRRFGQTTVDGAIDLDQLIATFFESTRNSGYSVTDVQARIARWFSRQTLDRVLVIEPEVELREILIAEIQSHLDMRVVGADIDVCLQPAKLLGAACVALYDHVEEIRKRIPAEVTCVFLHSSSIPKTLSQESRPSADTVLTVISRWPAFLQWARTTLVAIGIDPKALDLRDARQNGWKRGLTAQSFVITDSLLAARMPAKCRPHVYRVIANESIAALQARLGV